MLKEFLKEVILPTAVIFILGFGAAIGLAIWVGKKECTDVSKHLKVKTSFSPYAGCFIEYDGEMIPYSRWKIVQVNDAR